MWRCENPFIKQRHQRVWNGAAQFQGPVRWMRCSGCVGADCKRVNISSSDPPRFGTEQHGTPTAQPRVLVSFLVGCCGNTAGQHERLTEKLSCWKQILPSGSTCSCSLKYPFLFCKKNKLTTKQKLLIACVAKMGRPPLNLFGFRNAASPTVSKMDSSWCCTFQHAAHVLNCWTFADKR